MMKTMNEIDQKTNTAETRSNLLAPKLRFKGFDGIWMVNKLKDITGYVDYRGRAPAKADSGIFLVTAKNIKKGFIDYDCSKEYVSEVNYSEVMSKGLPKVGDILFTTEAPLGNIARVDNANIALAQRVIKLRAKPAILNDYLLHYMLGPVYQRLIARKAIGSTVLGISGKELHQTNLHYPTLPEQQKIASFLSAADKKIQQLTRKKELLEQYKKGVMQQLFSGELRFKDENGKGFPDWEEKRLGEVATFYNGKAYKQTELLDSGKYKVLRVGNFFSNSNWYYSDLELEDNKCCEKGDLLYAWSASFGPKIWDGDKTIFHYHIWKVENNKLISKQFLFHVLNNETEVMKTRSSNGFALLHITKGTIESWKCIIPSIDEQNAISSFIDQLNKRLESVANQITQTQTFKKGLLQQLFV
jgi:type I restriction enzyme S subunit